MKITDNPTQLENKLEPIQRAKSWLADYDSGKLTASDLYTRCLIMDLLKLIGTPEQGNSHQVEQWKRDLIAAGWVAESAIKWRAPDGSLWRGPYGAWKELQRQRENCSGCAVSRAGVGRCRIHEPVNPAATPAPVEQDKQNDSVPD